jgi:hypothetical protein
VLVFGEAQWAGLQAADTEAADLLVGGGGGRGEQELARDAIAPRDGVCPQDGSGGR